MEEINQLLENVGLSGNEIKIFIKLFETGECKAGEIISSVGISSSSFYNSINLLIKRGFVSYIVKNETKFYSAVSLENIIDLMEMQKKAFIKILPSLQKKRKEVEGEIKIFNNYNGLRALMSRLFDDGKKGNIFRFFSPGDEEYNLSTKKVYSVSKVLRESKHIRSYGFYPLKLKGTVKPSKITKHKFIECLPSNTLIFKDKIAIISWKEPLPFGVMIKSKEIADRYAQFFDYLWKGTK